MSGLARQRWRRNVVDAIGLVGLPLLAALLPRPAGFGLLRWLSRRGSFQHGAAEVAWSAAAPLLGAAAGREATFAQRFRLLRWVERCDTYLCVLRSERWWRRHVAVRGEWPAAGEACVLLTFHWGAAMWIWPVLRAQGIPAHFLARSPTAHDLGASRVSLWYAALRTRLLGRRGGLGAIFTGGSRARARDALARGEGIVGMLDLPARDGRAAAGVTLLGRPARLPAGLAELAIGAGARIAIFSGGVDGERGNRDLWVETLPRGADAETVLERYAAHLDRRLAEEPSAWQMWSESAAIFVPSDAPSRHA